MPLEEEPASGSSPEPAPAPEPAPSSPPVSPDKLPAAEEKSSAAPAKVSAEVPAPAGDEKPTAPFSLNQKEAPLASEKPSSEARAKASAVVPAPSDNPEPALPLSLEAVSEAKRLSRKKGLSGAFSADAPAAAPSPSAKAAPEKAPVPEKAPASNKKSDPSAGEDEEERARGEGIYPPLWDDEFARMQGRLARRLPSMRRDIERLDRNAVFLLFLHTNRNELARQTESAYQLHWSDQARANVADVMRAAPVPTRHLLTTIQLAPMMEVEDILPLTPDGERDHGVAWLLRKSSSMELALTGSSAAALLVAGAAAAFLSLQLQFASSATPGVQKAFEYLRTLFAIFSAFSVAVFLGYAFRQALETLSQALFVLNALPSFGGRLPSWSRWKLIQKPVLLGSFLGVGAAALFIIQMSASQSAAVRASVWSTSSASTPMTGGLNWTWLGGLLFGWTAFLTTLWIYWRDGDRFARDSEKAIEEWRASLYSDEDGQAIIQWRQTLSDERALEESSAEH